MTSRLEKTASRAAPANTQQRPSSAGRSMKTQSSTGLPLERDSLSPSSRQLFHTVSRQATLGALKASISAFRESGVRRLGAQRGSRADPPAGLSNRSPSRFVAP